jgi:hypothetical protein
VGEDDSMAGDPGPLAALLPHGETAIIEKRDHMRATGDPRLISAALRFVERHR